MPYHRAWIWCLAIIAISVVAFGDIPVTAHAFGAALTAAAVLWWGWRIAPPHHARPAETMA